MKMDLTKFKKIDEDAKGVTLMHPSGHKIKIAKKGVSPDTLEQLDSIPIHKALGGPMMPKSGSHEHGAMASKPSKSSNKMPGSPTEAKNDFTEPNAIGTDIPKAQLQNELNDKHFPDVVISALNKKAPPFGPLGSNESQHYPPCINPSCKSYGKSHPNCLCYGGAGGSSGEQGHFAKGGEVSKEYYCDNNRPHFKKCELYADGGQVQPQPQNPPQQPVTNQDNPQLAQAQDSMRKAFHFAKGGEAEEPTDSEKLDMAAQEASAGSAPVPAPQDPTSQQYSQEASPPPSPVGDSTAQAPVQASSDINPNPEQSSQPDQSADSAPDRAPAADLPTSSVDPATPAEHFQNKQSETLNTLVPEAQAFQNDLDNGHITPETYQDLFAKKDTLGKIGTIFGLLVGGMGAGLSHQPNMLMEMMNNQIKNDLDAQEKSSLNKQSFLKINQQALMNKANINHVNNETAIQAKALALANMRRTALHSLTQKVMNMPEGPAKQQQMQVLAIMNDGIQKEDNDTFTKASAATALQSVMFGGQGNQPNTQMMKSGFLGPQAEKIGTDIEDKQVPGFKGSAQAPLQPGEKAELRNGAVFDSAMNDLINWTKAHPNGAIKGSPEDQRGRALAGIVQGKFREATNGGVYKSGEQDFINKLVPEDPTKMFNAYRTLPKLQAVQKEMASQTDAKAKSYGLSGYSGAPKSQSSSGMTSKSGRPMIQKNGKWVYQ